MTSNRSQRLRYLLLLVLSLWALLSLGFRYLLEELSSYLVFIESQVEQKTPYQVKINQISGRWLLYTPIIEIKGAQLFNKESSETPADVQTSGLTDDNAKEIIEKEAFISVDKIAVEVDLFESLLLLRPRFKAVLIEGLRLSIQQDLNDKKIHVLGFAKNPNTDPEKQKVLIGSILKDYVLSTGKIYIKDVQIKAQLEKFPDAQLTIKALMLENKWFDHWLSADVELDDGSGLLRPFAIKTQFQGNPLDIEGFSARGYLGIDSSDLSRLLPDIKIAALSLQHLEAGFGVWFDIQKGIIKSFSVNAALKDIEITTFRKDVVEKISQLDISLHALGSLDIKLLLARQYSAQNLPQEWDVKVEVQRLLWAEQEYKNLALIIDHKLISKIGNPLANQWGEFDFIKTSNADIPLKDTSHSMFRLLMNYLPMKLIERGAYLTEPLAEYAATIERAAIQGQINSIQAVVIKQAEENNPLIYASAEIENLGFSEFLKIPAISGVDFYVELAPQALGISLDIKDASLAKSEHLFRGDIQLHTIKGNVLLERLPNEFVVHSDLIEVRAVDAQGDFVFSASVPERLYKDGIKEIPAWSLQGNLASMSLAKARIFFPARLPEQFLSWVDGFLQEGQVSGDIFLFAFAKKHEPDTFLTLAGDITVRDARLDYLPGKWPSLEGVFAQLQLHNDQVKGDVSEAKMFHSRLYNGQLFIPSYLSENLPRIKITGDVSGSLEDIQQLFLNSELKGTIGYIVEDWQLSGTHQSTINFDLPISDQQNSEPSMVSLNLDIDQASIYFPEVELGVEALEGDLQYSLAKGLRAEHFQGLLFGKPISGRIDTVQVDDEDVIQVFATASVEQKDLAQWQELWLFNNMSGQGEFRAVLSIGEEASVESVAPGLGKKNKSKVKADKVVAKAGKKKSKITSDVNEHAENSDTDALKGVSIVRADIYSDLEGMSINFPGGYSKQKKERRSTHLQLDVLPDALIYRVDYNNEIKAAIKTIDNEIERGRIHFGEGLFPLPSDKGLTVTGNVGFFDFDEWLDYFEKNILDEEPAVLSGNKVSDTEVDPAAIVNHIDVLINHFTGFGVRIENVKTFVVRGDKNWRIDVESEVLTGFFIVPDEELISRSNPIIADLEFLKISDDIFLDASTSVNVVDSGDVNTQGVRSAVLETEVELKPEDFSFIKLKVKSITLDNVKHGRWEIDLFPDDKGMDFNIHQLNYGLMAINGKGRWDYGAGKSDTKFKGHVRTAAVTKLFAAFNLTPSANSKGLMAIDIRWPGDPFSFDSEKMKGAAGLEIFDGSIIEIDIKSKKFKALGIFNLGFVNDIITLRIFKKIGDKLNPGSSSKKDNIPSNNLTNHGEVVESAEGDGGMENKENLERDD
jgi:uncharacterized protein YhdP